VATGTPVLMYHELVVAGRSLCLDEEGYSRYCIMDTTLEAQLAWLRAQGIRGCNISQTLELDANAPAVGITFDDGCETDLLFAAPRLLDAKCNATFFIVTSWIGQRGYLSLHQLRELRALGFELGAHSRTHAFLPDLDASSLRSEIAQCKNELEQGIGERIEHFSCPGGRWSPEVSSVAREAGFRTVSTSRPGMVTSATDRFRLPRTAILDGMHATDFARICRGNRQWLREANSALLSGAKRVMGNSLYENVRRVVLNR
jgi:peptidoglycan/xylan/chitin deacetylase (PgdA/CDA1 family)